MDFILAQMRKLYLIPSKQIVQQCKEIEIYDVELSISKAFTLSYL